MANSTTIYVGDTGRAQVDVTENKTLALSDQGVIQNVVTDAITITLPATAAANSFFVRNGGVASSSAIGSSTGSDGTLLVTIAPNASDKIQGAQISAADNKALLNTKATARIGDFVELCGDGIDGYNISRYKGVWARAA